MGSDPRREPDPARVPRDGRAVQPILWHVIERWHAAETAIDGWATAQRVIPPGQPAGWAALTEHLQLINTFQWHEEDRSREPDASDAVLAATKRSIDASNARRVSTVDALDSLVVAEFTDAGLIVPTAPLPSESPVSIIDRLTVLALKVYHLKEALNAARRGAGPTEDLQALHDRLRLLTDQHADLTECLDRLLADVRAGRVRLKLYRQVKIYRAPRTGEKNPETP
jgi:hypothetical protein